jgi:predicted metalloprotease with PDZ domain
MIYFKISCKNPTSQFLHVNLHLDILERAPLSLQLPAWRAGRYQLANFAQNIRRFRVFDENGRDIPFRKSSKDRWEIEPGDYKTVRVDYEYWAGKMDAGSAWVDDEQVYINLVNCCFEVLGRSNEEIEVTLDLGDFSSQVSTLLPVMQSTWKADNFQMLADSTVLAAKKLSHWEYSEGNTDFHIWIHGEVHFDGGVLLDRFRAFSKRLIEDFGEFPEQEYHFICQLLPYPHYHGVEHRRGTVITFGPAESLREIYPMEDLLGVSCHELYHAWNVCRIRPKELLPYDFSQETYTRCGLILEGVTTYMGDLYLLKSGGYDLPTYLRHLEKMLQREAAGFGWRNYTIQEASYDLWLDGYVPGVPDRKVNIYSHGALLALGIDILLLKNGSSLAQVMRNMWVDFGKPFAGYEFEDFEDRIVAEFSELNEIHTFLSDFVHGYEDLLPTLKALLPEIGISMEEIFGDNWLLHRLGVRTGSDGVVSQLHPDSKACLVLMKDDRIVNWPVNPPVESKPLTLQLERHGRYLEVALPLENGSFFPLYSLVPREATPLSERWMA